MKKLAVLLMSLLLVALAAGCSAGPDDGSPETLGESQEALACTYPIGSGAGGTNLPIAGKDAVTAVTATSKSWSVTYTPLVGSPVSGPITWDPASSTNISGTGWTRTGTTLLTKVNIYGCGAPGTCVTFNWGLPDAQTISFAGSTGAPVTQAVTMNQGITKIEPVTSANGNYRAIKFTGYHNGVLTTATRNIASSGGC